MLAEFEKLLEPILLRLGLIVDRLRRPTRQKAERTTQVGKGGGKRGTGAHNGRKGVGTQGRRYVREMMRESEGEEAVHA